MSDPLASQELPPSPTRRAELIISRTLLGGVMLSMVILLVGAVMSFARHPEYVSSHTELNRLTHPGAAKPQTLLSVLHGVLAGRGEAVIALGLLVLIATPVVRVAVSILAFRAERDRTYVAITSGVLLLLILSFVLGKL